MLQIEVNPLVESLIQRLEVAKELADTDAILDESGAFILNRIRTRFLAEKDPDEVPWTPSQAAIKRRSMGGTGTLYDTGRLFRSIQLSSMAGENQRLISTDVSYAKYLVDMWPFMGVNQKDADILEQLLQIRILEAIEKANIGG